MWKLRKQYSKNYQVVELQVEGNDLEDYDLLADWLDKKLQNELDAIPNSLLTKDNSGGLPTKVNAKPKNKQQYQNKRNTYKKQATGKDFGSAKQWNIVNDERNADKLADAGIDPEEIESYEELQHAIKVCFGND